MRTKSNRGVRRVSAEKICLAVVSVFLFLWSLTLIYPFIWAFLNSLKSPMEYNANSFGLPEQWRFSNWLKAFEKLNIQLSDGSFVGLFGMIVNSVWYMLGGAFLNLLLCTMFSYALAKYEFRGKKFLFGFSVVIMMIPIYGSMPAQIKVFAKWGLSNSPLFLIGAMGCIGGSNLLILTSAMRAVSWTYAEAVFIDGGGHWTVFWKVMLPQFLPILSALFILNCIGRWNDYMTPYIYLSKYPTLATGLFLIEVSGLGRQNAPLYFASILISVIPIMALFIACQKSIMSNVTVGGIKG